VVTGLKHQKEKRSMDYFCWTGRFGQGHERLHCGWQGKSVRLQRMIEFRQTTAYPPQPVRRREVSRRPARF